MKKLYVLLVILAGVSLLSSCTKEILPNPDPQTMNDLVIKDSFNWKTTTDYEFTVTGNINRLLTVTSTDGTIYKKVSLTANQPLKVTLTIPSYENKVNLRFNGQIIEVALVGTSITYSFK